MAEKCQRSSFAWLHFDLDNDANKVCCEDCKLVLAFNNSTLSIIKHLHTSVSELSVTRVPELKRVPDYKII